MELSLKYKDSNNCILCMFMNLNFLTCKIVKSRSFVYILYCDTSGTKSDVLQTADSEFMAWKNFQMLEVNLEKF